MLLGITQTEHSTLPFSKWEQLTFFSLFSPLNQVHELILMSVFLFFPSDRQLLSPNIQQKHYLSNGYAMDGGRHVSITNTINTDSLYLSAHFRKITMLSANDSDEWRF